MRLKTGFVLYFNRDSKDQGYARMAFFIYAVTSDSVYHCEHVIDKI